MKENNKTQAQLIKEVAQLRQRIAELEAGGHKRNQLEDALRMERDKAQQYLDIAEVVLVALNKKGEIILINRKGNQILGYKEGELLGKNWFTTCLPSHLRKKMKSGFLKLMTGEREITEFYEKPVLTKSRTERIIAWHNSILKDAQGTNIGTLSSGMDITERNQAEEALQESEEKYRNLVERANDGIGIAQDGILHYVNPRLAQMIGYAVEELIGAPFSDFFVPEEVPKVVDHYKRRMAGKNVTPIYESALRHKNGKRIEVELNAGIIPYKGKRADLVFARDVTERKKAEEALRESEATLGAFINAPADSVLLLDSRGVILDLNKIAAERLGKSRDDLISTLADGSLSEDIAKRRRSIISQIFETSRPVRFEDERDGIWYDTVAHPITDKDGAVSRIAIIARDITERKEAENAMRESEERFRLAFENANTGVCLVDLEGNLTRVNTKMSDIFGYTKEELERMTVNDIAYPEDIDKSPEFIQKTLQGEINRGTFEKRYFHKKGHVVTCEVSSSLVRDAEGTPLYFISHVHDITERKQAEASLRESEERYRRLVDNSLLGIGISCGNKIVFANPALLRIFGYDDHEEFTKIPLLNSVAPASREFIAARMEKVTQGKALPAEFEYDILRKEGSTRTLLASSQHFTSTSKTYSQTTFQDITGRKQAEELIKIRLRLLEFAATHSRAELLQKTLDEVCEFTKSSVGFYHFVNADQTTLSLQAWSTRTVEEFCKATGAGMHYSINEAGVWVDCIRECRPVIHNDYASLPHRKGMPEGHAAIVRELVVPIMRNDRFVAIIGIGNKPQDYTDQDVQVVSYLADVAWEIAERKRTGEALGESEKKYRQVVENATDIIYSTDINGNFTYANSVALKVTCYSLEELQRFNYLDLVVPEYRDQLKEIYGNQFRGRQATTYVEFPFSNKFGEVMWFGQNASLMIEGGKIIGFQAIARDISEKKHAEEALRESEEKYRDLVENINDILYATDEKGIVTYVSPAIESLSGYAPSEIIGRSFFEFLYREDVPYMMEQFQRDASGDTEPHEYRMVTKSGVVRWVRTSSRPFFKGDSVVGLRGILTDITERKQAEGEAKRGYEQLQETLHSTVKALASTVEMKDQYTAGHQPRVTQLACAIAGEMGLSEDQIEGIRMAASIHDIGKIMVPAEILNKPGPLSEIQYEMIKMHPRAGYDILKGLKLPWPVAQIILQHHERLDGSGYPQGLSGEEIMVEARILTVANVVEAMNAHRPYRPAYDIKEALAEISKNRVTWYDPAVVDACLRLFTEKGFTLAPVSR